VTQLAALFALFVLATASGVFAQSHHTVSLSWTASTDAAANPSLTYNVYRSTACSGTFVLLNATQNAATTYIDSDVFPGATYCYQVTALLSGAESVASNAASAVMPAATVVPPVPASATCAHRGAIAGWLRCVASMPARKLRK
jgi:fibronectin type 3 domain-containing protein